MGKTDFSEVIKGINRKDEKAWKVLFDHFYVPLCHHSLRILRDEQVVADVVQETLIRLWNSNICFDSSRGMVVYLYRAVTNNSLKYLRDRNVEEERLKKWLEEEELSLAEWVDYKDVPDDPEGLSLTREMMVHFRKSREKDHQND